MRIYDSLIAGQPKCWLLKERYDNEFSSYKAQFEEAIGHNRRALRILDDFSHVKARLADIQNDTESLRELKTKNREFVDECMENYALKIFGRLGMLKIGFEKLSNEKLEGEEELRKEFEKNSSILNQLVQPTHNGHPWRKVQSQLDLSGFRLREFDGRQKA